MIPIDRSEDNILPKMGMMLRYVSVLDARYGE